MKRHAKRSFFFLIQLIGLIIVSPQAHAQSEIDSATAVKEVKQRLRDAVLKATKDPITVNKDYDEAAVRFLRMKQDWLAFSMAMLKRATDCEDDRCTKEVIRQLKPAAWVHRGLLENEAQKWKVCETGRPDAEMAREDALRSGKSAVAFMDPLFEKPSKQLAQHQQQQIEGDKGISMSDATNKFLKTLNDSRAALGALSDEALLSIFEGNVAEHTEFQLGVVTTLDAKTFWYVPKDSLAYKLGFRTDDKLIDMSIETEDGAEPFPDGSLSLLKLMIMVFPHEKFIVHVQRLGEKDLKAIKFDLGKDKDLRQRLEIFQRALPISTK